MTLSQKAIDYAKQRGLTIGSSESKPSKLLFKDPSVNEEFNQLRPDLKYVTETNPYGGRITSGYRDEEQNQAVGGVPNSYHTKGLAVDIGLDDNTDKRIAYYKSKGLQPILESDHLHVEPPSDDWKAPIQQRSQTGLSQRAKAYAKQRGLSYPGMEIEPQNDTIQPKEEPSLLEKADFPGLLKTIGRGALVTGGQMVDPALELAKRFNPAALGNEAVKAMGGTPISNKYVDEPIDYLRGLAQKASQTPLTEYEQNKGLDITAPIAKRLPEYAQRGVEEIASGLGIDKQSKPVQAIGGAAGSLAEIAQSFTSPTNIAMLGMAGLPNAAQKVAAGAFAPMMLKGSEEGFNRGMEGLKTGNVREAAAGLTGGIASAGLAGAAGMGALAEKPSMQQISDAMKARPMEFLDYPDPTGAAKFDVPQLTAPKINVAPREYIPEGRGVAYTSEPISALKKEPYNVKKLVEEMPIEQRYGKEVSYKDLTKDLIKEKVDNSIKAGYKLTRGKVEGLEAFKAQIEDAIPGRKYFQENEKRGIGVGAGGVTGNNIYEPSTFPVKNLGPKDLQLAAIKNIFEGKPLTSNQKIIIDKLLERNSEIRKEALPYSKAERLEKQAIRRGDIDESISLKDIPEDVDTSFDPTLINKVDENIFSKPTGFTGTLNTIKKIESPYPTSYKAEATTPETLKTLDTQVKAMEAKKVPAVLVTPGEMTPKMTKGMMTLDTDVGKWIYDPMRINKQEIISKVEDGTYGEILGHVEPKSPKATQTVAAIMPDGSEAKTSIVSPENVDVQSQILKQQFPQAEIKVGGEELAGQVLDQRNNVNLEEADLIKQMKSGSLTEALQDIPEVNAMTGLIKGSKEPLISGTGLDTGKVVKNRLSYNPEKFNTVEDVESLFKKTSAENKEFKSQRISKSDQNVKELANLVGVKVDDLLDARPGSIANAETVYKSRQITMDLAKDLNDTLKSIDVSVATPEQLNLIKNKYLRLVGTMKAVAGFRTEASNVFRQFRMKVADGETGILQELATDLKRAGIEAGDNLISFAKKSRELTNPSISDKLWHLWYQGILSGPVTHVRNIVSNAGNLALEFGRVTTTSPKELPGAISGIYKGLLKGFEEGKRVLKEGDISKFEKRGLLPINFEGKLAPLNIYDYVGRALSAADAIFKNSGKGMEAGGAAYLKAAKEGFKGNDLLKRSQELFEKFYESPETEAFGSRMTYQQKPAGVLGSLAHAVSYVTRNVPGARLIAPFTNVVANVVNAGLDWSPIGISRALKPDLIKGHSFEINTGRQKYQQLGRGALGTLGMAYFATLASEGKLTGNGPSDYNKRQQLIASGWKPNSIKKKDKYYPIANLGPIAVPLSVVANSFDAIKYGKLDEKEWLERTSSALMGVSKTILDMSFLKGVNELISSSQDYEGKGSKYLTKFAAQTVSSAVPALIKQVARLFDPNVYETKTLREKIQSNVRYTSGLKSAINIWGEPIKGDKFSGLESSQLTKDPVKRYLAENQLWISVPSKSTQFKDPSGETRNMTDSELYDYIKLSGPEIKKRLELSLTKLENIKSNDEKQDFINEIVRDVRSRTKKQMRKSY